MRKSIKSHFQKIFILGVIYLIIFFLLERVTPYKMYYTETWLDKYIPFNEYFVIFYIAWYFFIFFGFLYFVFKDDFNFNRTCYYMFSGMFIALTLYTLFPSGQSLRVNISSNNIYTYIINLLYTIDTSTNVCPSLHVYNSIMMYVSLDKSECLQNHPLVKRLLLLLVILICMSTVLIKQHTIVDVIAAFVLCIIIYRIGEYKFNY